ncbi:hypothetical protein W03_01110 [Nitrosomonas sp. PY1]|uniref:hypothetical protein n=1 Tax=Nitrosomonas sp. PY1 TaxID=1803906 RepID=UPI001FC8D141|nr:hypothetical protein [Nitrosomonas sp. PY1]GKS68107.1 hypothetical protein W03_01110 [Nitrosomonas sp. PY1]
MLTKIFLASILSLVAISCSADSDVNQSKPLIDPQKKAQLSTETNQQSQSDSSIKKDTSELTNDNNQKKQSPMVKFCQKHPC